MKIKDLNLLSIGNTIQLAGAIYSGEGRTFLCLFPGEALDEEVQQLDMDQAEWEVFIRQTDLLEVEALVKGDNDIIGKAIVRKSTRQIDQGVSWKVYKRDGYACRYCGNNDTPLTMDHLIPWEMGGPNTEVNLVAACRKCNKTRGNTLYADWLQHPHYLRVSKALSPAARTMNEAVLRTLDAIPLVYQKRSR